LDLVLDFPENLPDLIFDSIRPAGLLLETSEAISMPLSCHIWIFLFRA
jgi:hypothetical protein